MVFAVLERWAISFYKVRRSQMAVRFSGFWLFCPTFYNAFVLFLSPTYLRRLFSCHWNSLKTSSTRGVESLLDSFLATHGCATSIEIKAMECVDATR